MINVQNQNIIQVSNLSKTYPGADQPAINRLSFSVRRGEIFGLLGPNGAGKTTTISILSGLLLANDGHAMIGKMDWRSHSKQIKQMIGVVPQEIALYPSLTARENLTYFGRLYGLGGKQLRQRISECLELVALEKSADRRISTFSGGMKRRANLIAGLIHQPQILYLDEPTVGVDVQSRNIILDYLRQLQQNGATIIYTSHYLEEAQNLCTRVTIIDNGQVIIQGRPQELIAADAQARNLEDIFLRLTGHAVRD